MNEQGGQTPIDGEKCYGCIFCLTGKEELVAENLERTNPDIRSSPVRQVKRKTSKGQVRHETSVIFPGYVFMEVPANWELDQRFPKDGVVSVLTYPGGDWRLCGNDEKFARWLFSCDGTIQISKAYREGGRIRIISGPLKDFEGQILRVDKRNKSGQIALTFENKVVKIWLGFELVDSLEEESALPSAGGFV